MEVNKKFDRYTLLHQIGKGGMAEIYLAKSSDNEILAIKTISDAYSSNIDFAKMFEAEQDIVKYMKHKNIAIVYPAHRNKKKQKHLFLALEFIKGKNLRQILKDFYSKKTDLTFAEKIYITKEMASGLYYAHTFIHPKTNEKLNIVHSDISPQNVMINVEGEVKLIDFGISKTRSNNPFQPANMRANTLQGKFNYMSPEQAEGFEIDQKTDVFSLGVVLWEILAKDRLFYAKNANKILLKVKEAHIPSLEQMNNESKSKLNIPQQHVKEVEKIVKKALVRDKNLRFSAKELHEELSQLLKKCSWDPDFSPVQLGDKIKKAYTSDFKEIDEIIQKALLEKNIEVEEKTETITVNNSFLAESDQERNLAVSRVLFDQNTASEASKSIHFKTIPSASSNNNHHQKSENYARKKHYIKTNYEPYHKKIQRIDFSLVLQIGLFLIFSTGISSLLYFKITHPEETEKEITKWTENTTSMFKTLKDMLSPKNKEMASQTAKTPVPSITLFISSTPEGAKIFIDGVWSYKRTPRQITFLKNKPITLKMAGYKNYTLSTKEVEKAILEKNQTLIILKK